MRAISLFSGAGGFELGFQRASIETVLQVEIDPVCLSVLERHWPRTARVDDVRAVSRERKPACRGAADGLRAPVDQRWGQAGPGLPDRVDLVYGGFPCQDVSVAGQRAGLRGERSGLWHEFHRVVSELRPRWVVVENVPGLLSSGAEPGADFGVVLRGLVDLGYGVAWRVLDARWFGVPQRRRRVFVVSCLGDAPRAAQVLAVCESCGGDRQTSGEAGQDTAPTLDDGARGTSLDLPMTWKRRGGYGYSEANGEVLTLEAEGDAHQGGPMDTPLVADVGVRRLTPLECERLMGWPDGHTRYAADGREIPDSHRYRLCGNGVVATVAEWIGHRLVRSNCGYV